MGSCVTCPRTYNVRSKSDTRKDRVTPTPSININVEKFDSLPPRTPDTVNPIYQNGDYNSSKKYSIHDHTQGTEYSDSSLDKHSHRSNKSKRRKQSHNKVHQELTITDAIVKGSARSSDSGIRGVYSSELDNISKCETISNRSEDSTLGSDLAYSSRSDRTVVQVEPYSPVELTVEQNLFGGHSVSGDTLGDGEDTLGEGLQHETSRYGKLKRSRGRSAFMASRLGHRESDVSKVSPRSPNSTQSADVLLWKKGDRIGKGSFGTVWLGMTSTGELIAVKQMQMFASLSDMAEAEREYDKIYQEVAILKTLMHRNIVGYLGSNYESDTGYINIFMEYVAGGSLSSVLEKFGPLEENITARYTKQLLDAIAYMHRNNVVHRDIKSHNIMLMPNGIIKLIDFGCAKKLELRLSKSGSHLMRSLRGTPYWMAPEVINETGHGKKSDVWSLGCTVYEMLTGSPPWGDREPIAAIFAIGSEEFPIPQLPDSFSWSAREFTKLCMVRDKHKRPGAERLLMHTFIGDTPWEEPDTDTCLSTASSRQTSIECSLSRALSSEAELDAAKIHPAPDNVV